MKIKYLIKKLNQYPKDTGIRIEIKDQLADENFWLSEIEYNHGSGYELHSEIVLRGDL